MKIGGGSPEKPRGPREVRATPGKEAAPAPSDAGVGQPIDQGAERVAKRERLMGKAAGPPRGKGGPDEAQMARDAEAAFEAWPARSKHPELKGHVGKLTSAISSAWRDWQGKASLVDVKINGPIASGGQLKGPELGSLIRDAVPKEVPSKIADAVARGVGEQWKGWQNSVRVPDLPWYPSFAAVPGPQAERTANVPTPLTELRQDRSFMSADSLLKGMTDVAKTRDEGVLGILKGIAEGVQNAFTKWLGNSKVGGVQGKGPVPGYAPPYVPVGPVVAGDNIATPGHIIS